MSSGLTTVKEPQGDNVMLPRPAISKCDKRIGAMTESPLVLSLDYQNRRIMKCSESWFFRYMDLEVQLYSLTRCGTLAGPGKAYSPLIEATVHVSGAEENYKDDEWKSRVCNICSSS